MKILNFDVSFLRNLKLRQEKIVETDLPLIDRYWNDMELNKGLLVNYGRWVVNEDKSVILKGMGGGSFEIPEMYDLIYKEAKVHLECGGGGDRAKISVPNPDGSYHITIFVSRIRIPPELSQEEDSVLTAIVETLAVESFRSSQTGKLTVQFPSRSDLARAETAFVPDGAALNNFREKSSAQRSYKSPAPKFPGAFALGQKFGRFLHRKK